MLFPIGDDNQGRLTTPFVVYAVIALNFFVFLFLQQAGTVGGGCGLDNPLAVKLVRPRPVAVSRECAESPSRSLCSPRSRERPAVRRHPAGGEFGGVRRFKQAKT